MNGGIPYEKDVAVEASAMRGCKNTQQRSAQSRWAIYDVTVLQCICTVVKCTLLIFVSPDRVLE